jgi:hypothetical protein
MRLMPEKPRDPLTMDNLASLSRFAGFLGVRLTYISSIWSVMSV